MGDSDVETSEDDEVADMDDTPKVVAEGLMARPYQVELLNKALEKNIIVCLGTGTGKTFISVLLIKELSHQVRKEYLCGGQRTFFLVNTVPLVTQQSKVIQRNTDLTVKGYYGEMGVDFWDKGKWLAELKANQVLVMTAQIFADLLGHAKIKLSDVNLIVFDECHHARKDHPYAQVMRYFDSYDLKHQPRILGLTASVVNGKVKPSRIENAIVALESILKASCETSSDEMVEKYATKPEEILYPYKQGDDMSPEELQLQNRLQEDVINPWLEFHKDCRNASVDSKIAKDCADTLVELGSSAANCVAKFYLDDVERIQRGNRLIRNSFDDWLNGYLATQLRQIQTVYNSFTLNDHTNQQLSAKMKALVDILKQYGHRQTTDKESGLCGIVFVERRCTAAILCEQIKALSNNDPELNFIKCDFVVGHGLAGPLSNSTDMSSKKQDKVLSTFRTHQLNLIIATSVVEEGLDVPKCNLVVRFDFPKTYQSYVQSKGRARAKDSYYCLLTEEDEWAQEGDLEMYRAIEEYLASACYDRPVPSDEDSADALDTEPLPPYRTNEGASIRMNNSISTLCRYCTKLPGDKFTRLMPDYTTCEVGENAFQTTVKMPLNCPIKEKVKGDVMPRKKLSKMAAAYKACVQLYTMKELDEFLYPVESLSDESSDEEDDMELGGEGRAKTGTKRKRQVYQRKIPEILDGSLPKLEESCHLFAFTRCRPNKDPDDGRLLTLGILSKSKIPPIRRFTLYPDDGEVVICVKYCGPVPDITQRHLSLIERFHTELMSALLRRLFESAARSDGYYIVPLTGTQSTRHVTTVKIDFNKIKQTRYRSPTMPDPQELEAGESIITPQHRTRERFIVQMVCENLTPRSPFPDPSRARTFEDYYNTVHQMKTANSRQPLILVKRFPERINFLVDRKKLKSKENKSKREIHFIPELCILDSLPASLLLEASELPSILYRMNALLLVMEIKKLIAGKATPSNTIKEEDLPPIGAYHKVDNKTSPSSSLANPNPRSIRGAPGRDAYNREFLQTTKDLQRMFSNKGSTAVHPDSSLLLQALTTSGSGDSFDLERLEMLGDAFLKQAVSIYLYCRYDNKNEGKLTRRKVKQISNKNLFNVSKRKNLPGYIQNTVLDRKAWAPPCLQAKHSQPARESQRKTDIKQDVSQQTISDKSIADSVEALIGAYLVSCGYRGALHFMDFLGLKVLPHQDGEDDASSKYATFETPTITPLTLNPETLDDAKLQLRNLECQIKYEFRDKLYLLQALTHSSYDRNVLTPDCYQRMEFLGDAVLDFLVTECLYSRNPHLSPGQLTDLRQALVNNNIFAKIAVEYDYQKYLQYTSPEWFKKINDFVAKLEDDKEEGRPQIDDDPFIIMSHDLNEAVEAPKVLGDIFESVAGAVFLDSGMDVVVTWKVYYRMLKPYIDHYSAHVPYNPIRMVHENDSDLKFSEAKVLDDGKVECVLEVYWGSFIGKGANKRIAKAAASTKAMKMKQELRTSTH